MLLVGDAESEAWYDATADLIFEALGRHWDGSIDRPRLEEELVSLVEDAGAYLLLLEEGWGDLKVAILRSSESARGSVWIRDVESGKAAQKVTLRN